MNPSVPYKQWNFLMSCGTSSFSRWTYLHRVRKIVISSDVKVFSTHTSASKVRTNSSSNSSKSAASFTNIYLRIPGINGLQKHLSFHLQFIREQKQIYVRLCCLCVCRVAQSVQRLATGWTGRGSNSGEGEFFRTCPDRPCGPTTLLYNGYRVFLGGKERPGRDADPSPPSSAVVMKEQSYTSTPPMGRTDCTEPQ